MHQKVAKTGMRPVTNKAQAGICAETSLHGLVLLLNSKPGQLDSLREKLSGFPELVNNLDQRFSEALLSAVMAFGSECWNQLWPAHRPRQLSTFPEIAESHYVLQPTDFDMAIVLRSDRADCNYFAGRVLLEWLAPDVWLQHEQTLFHYLDDRNLFGFSCVPDNPHGRLRREVALLNDEDDELLAQGSYLYLQQYELDIKTWQELSVEKQRQIMGREKVSGKAWPGDQPGHARKASLALSEQGNPVLVWHQLPAADMRNQRQLDLLWSRSPAAMQKWLQRRFVPDQDGYCDPLLDYMQSNLNAAFFAPPLNWFKRISASTTPAQTEL